MKKIKGGICAPEGFIAGGIYAGVKRSRRKDLALVFSKKPATLASLFTRNKVKAAPVIVSRQHAAQGVAQAIIANSGNANCSTGAQGLRDAKMMIRETAEALAIAPKLVLVTSTGSIGEPLQMDKIVPGIKHLAKKLSKVGGTQVAEAILTTDTRKKEIAFEVPVGSKKFKIGGVAKGSGMIHPNMATMHAFITTDAKVPPELLQRMLTSAVDESFNMITVDRETSTNDCVFALANGESKVTVGGFLGISGEARKKFEKALRAVCIYLAREIARDGEGATKLVRVVVKGSRSLKGARLAAKQIAGSDLVKAAFFGEDPNFGRIIAALGASGAGFDPDKVSLKLQKILLLRNGCGITRNLWKAAARLKAKEVLVEINLHQGKKQAVAYGCDLTCEYVKINARYHT